MSGFANAPVSKGVLAVTLVASIASISARTSTVLQLRNPWRALMYQSMFSSPGELVVGLLLLYHFRLFERHWGSRRYGSFVVLTGTLSASLSLSVLSLLQNSSSLRLSFLPGGPYGLIFASLVQYYFDIPVSFPVNVIGLRLSDKTVNYLLALQLLLSSPPQSIVASMIGLMVGVAYRLDFLKLRKFKLPDFVATFCSKVFLPLLLTNEARGRGGRGGGRDAGGMPGGVGMGGGRQAQDGTQGYRDTLLGNPFERGGMGGGIRPMGAAGGRPPVMRQVPAVDAEILRQGHEMLCGMGFTDETRNRALLTRFGGDMHRALDELLNS